MTYEIQTGYTFEDVFEDFKKEIEFEFETFEPELNYDRLKFSLVENSIQIEASTLGLAYFKPIFNVAENMGFSGTVFPLDNNSHLGLLIILNPINSEE